MKIKIGDIGPDGKRLVADVQHDVWLAEALERGLPDLYVHGEAARVAFEIFRIGETLQAQGAAALNIHPICARCAESFALPFEIPIKRVFLPKPTPLSTGGFKGEEELDTEDLDVSYYQGDELEITPIVIEEILLALPLVFLCRPDCQGLCPKCGANLNAAPCRCFGGGSTV